MKDSLESNHNKKNWSKPYIEEISVNYSLGKESFPVGEQPKNPGPGLDVDVDAS